MNLDITQYLKDTENSLRDLISILLEENEGVNWLKNCGVTDDRLSRWTERKKIEKSRLINEADERLIYYADFYDIRTILKKKWEPVFSKVFGEWKVMEVFLAYLEKYRDTDAHRRELLPYQKNLIIGISGEIRTKITSYRSKMETAQDYFPRIECVKDNFGNMCTAHNKSVFTKLILRPGDELEFVVTATDPLGENLLFSIEAVGYPTFNGGKWQDSNMFTYRLTEKDIAKDFYVQICIQSKRPYHASGNRDDSVLFSYTVLPK